eukprot:g45409.t1
MVLSAYTNNLLLMFTGPADLGGMHEYQMVRVVNGREDHGRRGDQIRDRAGSQRPGLDAAAGIGTQGGGRHIAHDHCYPTPTFLIFRHPVQRGVSRSEDPLVSQLLGLECEYSMA